MEGEVKETREEKAAEASKCPWAWHRLAEEQARGTEVMSPRGLVRWQVYLKATW